MNTISPLIYNSTGTPRSILDYNSSGATSTIAVGPDVTFTNLTVTLNISHPRMPDLQAILIGPNDASAPLPNLNRASVVNTFYGTGSGRYWRVKIVDTVRKQTGTLSSWTLTIEY